MPHAAMPQGGGATPVRVRWFKTAHVRHLVLVNQASPYGELLNSATINLLCQWIQSVYIPSTAGRASLYAQLVSACERVISEQVKRPYPP